MDPINFPTADEVSAAIAPDGLAEPDSGQIAIVTARITAELEAKKARELDAVVTELRSQNEKMITAELDKIRQANKPLEPKEIEALLNQEYAEFAIKIRERGGAERKFVIRELPQSTEVKLAKLIRDTLLPSLKALAALDWRGTAEARMMMLADKIPEAMEMMATACAICLDPFGDEKIDREWVETNMGVSRIFAVLQAQVHAGRYRDFFLAVSRSIPGSMIG